MTTDPVPGNLLSVPGDWIAYSSSELSAYSKLSTPELIEQLNKYKEFAGQISPLSTFEDFPSHPNGLPGVATLDFDGDGDQYMFVTNEK